MSNADFDGHNSHRESGFFVDYGIGGHNVLIADGSTRFIPIISEDCARDLLTGNYSEINEFAVQEKA